jgi:DNA polymerase III delta prime subunit
MALTDVEFQKRLNDIKTEDGKTIWEQIKDALFNLLNTLGLDIKPGSALATSVKDTFDLIEANQDVLKANNITTESFMEHGTKYKFEVNGNGEVIKASYSQGMSTVYNPMNPKNAQKKYENLKAGITTQPPTQPTEVEENKFDYQGKSIETAFPLTTGQEQALESLVDFVRQDDEKTITLQGAAGTGKTAVIGYLQKYFGGTGINFVYLAPTHAATAELAFATVKSGNKELPMTVQSAVSDRIDNKTQTRKISFTKKLENKLGYVGNIIVVDEVSMLSAKDYLALNKAIENKDVKIVFMGDILQIPEVNVANPEVKQVSLAFSQPRQLNLTEVKRTESDAILEVLGTLRKNTQPQIPVIPNTEEIKYLSGTEYNKELVDTLKKEPEDTLVISYTNTGVTTTNSKIRGVLGRTGDLQENDIIVGYLGYSSKQIEKGNIANSIRYTVQDVQKVGSTYKIIATSKKLKALKDAGVNVSDVATGNYLQLNDGDAFKFSDLTQEDFDKNNREVSDVMKRLHNAKKAALQNPRLWPDYYSIEGETAKFFSVNSVGDNYIYNPTTDKMEKYTPLVHKDLRRSFPELYVEKGIDLGHAITIHKSQGSTVKNVFFDADTLPKGTSSKLFKNNDQIGNEKHSLIYVAMSRASNKLVVNNNQMSNFYTLRGAPFNLSALGNIESLREMPIDTESESNQPSLDDLEAYYRSLGEDQTLETSPINPKEVEKYLLICGK